MCSCKRTQFDPVYSSQYTWKIVAPQVIYFTSRISPRNITTQLGNGLLVHALWWVKFHRLSMIRVNATRYAGHADPLSQAWTSESKQAKANGADAKTNMAVIWWRQEARHTHHSAWSRTDEEHLSLVSHVEKRF